MKYIGVLLLSLFTLTCFSQQPLLVNAGRDTVFCDQDPTDFSLGGTPTASGGVTPYTYSWEMYPDTIQTPLSDYEVNDVLSNTTIPNPVIDLYPSIEDSIFFILTVIDDNGSTLKDTVSIHLNMKPIITGFQVSYALVGDTIKVESDLFNELYPLVIDWESTPEIIRVGSQFDTVYTSGQVVEKSFTLNQAVSSPIAPNYTITNAGGCVRTLQPYTHFLVYPLSTEETTAPGNQVEIYPNPSDGVIKLRTDNNLKGAVLRISNLKGQVVWQKKVVNQYQDIDIRHLPAGNYTAEIFQLEKRIAVKKLIKL